MNVSLSHKLSLKINGYPIVLEQPLEAAELRRHGIRKAGFLARLMLRPARGERIFWAKNCILTYLDDEPPPSIAPVTGGNAAPRNRFQTAAFFHFTGHTLSGFAFQLTNHSAGAGAALGEFEKNITAQLGAFSSTESNLKTWKEAGQQLVVDFPAERRHGYIHLMIDAERLPS